MCENSRFAENGIVAAQRDFYFCEKCYLIFVTDEGRLSWEKERERYLLHQNNKEDERYVNFLKQAIDPSLRFLKKGMKGLDFGCGHEPVLAYLLNQYAYTCDFYDPFFFPSIEKEHYDFIFSTEVVEHFFNPSKEFDTIDQLLARGGYLIVMTSFWDKIETFGDWYYKNDPAHVAFYHYRTFQFLARKFKYDIVYSDLKKVIIFYKP